MAPWHVGLPALSGDIARYAQRWGLAEVRPVDTSIPAAARLRSWRKQVPPAFAFSVVLPRVVGELRPCAALDAALAKSLEVARTLEARAIVLATPSTVTPTELNRKRLADLAARIPHDAVTLAWEPHGLWEIEESARVARRLGLVLVVDAAREPVPDGPVAYVRLRGLGESSRLGPQAIERVADAIRDRREAFVVVETSGVMAVAKALAAARTPERSARAVGLVVKPRTRLVAEDEEQ